jgi:serine/threonine protein kinase
VLQNRYRILSLLNQGGMGRVYLAEDLRFRSQVVVKEAYRDQEDFRRAFAREAALLHRLRHRALPHVSDYFTEEDAQYLVMQLFPGKDLDELLDEKIMLTGEAFAVSQVLRWAAQSIVTIPAERVSYRREFHAGDAVRFMIESNISGYLYVFHVENDGNSFWPQPIPPRARVRAENSARPKLLSSAIVYGVTWGSRRELPARPKSR